jgi:hypothetical protein
MRRWIVPALVLLMAALVSLVCGAVPAQQNHEPKTIRLKFSPVPAKPLRKARPKPGWLRVKTVKIQAFLGEPAVAIHLYLNPDSSAVGEMHGFLEDNQVSYGLGFVSSYGAESVKVRNTNRQHNHNVQWQIEGALGAACDRLVVVSFDRKKNRWVCLLSEESNCTEHVDLGGDGEEEIVTRFGVEVDYTIYRWGLEHFESVYINHALGSDHAEMAQRDGKPILQPFKIINVINGERRDGPCLRYAKGKLIELGVR